MISIANKLLNRFVITLPVILMGLFLIGLVSSCSGTPTAQPNPVQNNGGNLPPAEAPAPSTAGPMASPNSGAPAQAVAVASAATVAPSQEHIVGIGSATVVTIHGKIVSVNRAKKLVTIEGPRGKRVTLHVYNPYNLAAAKPGEAFVVRFYEIVTIREKRPGESIAAASLEEGVVSAAPEQTPGAVIGKQVQLVATIDAINRDKETVTLKGPDGVVETTSVANPANLRYVKVGDEIVITLTNVVAIWLEKDSGA